RPASSVHSFGDVVRRDRVLGEGAGDLLRLVPDARRWRTHHAHLLAGPRLLQAPRVRSARPRPSRRRRRGRSMKNRFPIEGVEVWKNAKNKFTVFSFTTPP